jgi:hypothetical protein
MGNTSAGVYRIRECGARDIIFVKQKDIDLAVTKSIESGLITFNQKKVVRQTIQDIVNHTALTFSEQHLVLNEQTIIQRKENNKAR